MLEIPDTPTPHLAPLEWKLLERLRAQDRQNLDLTLDRPWLLKLTPDPNLLLHRLTRKQVAHRLQRGRYWLNTDGRATRFPLSRLWSLDALAPILLERLDCPYYVSWRSALWHYNLLDQQSRRLFVATTRRKRNANPHPFSVRFVTVSKERFYGFSKQSIGGYEVMMADIEKGLVDAFSEPSLVAHPAIVINTLIRAARGREFDPERLAAYALRFPNHRLRRRIGFWMERLALPGWEPLEQAIGDERAYALLMPGHENFFDDAPQPLNKRWRVIEDLHLIDVAESPK
jgi:predicted transcriptional regulator of viral defense system